MSINLKNFSHMHIFCAKCIWLIIKDMKFIYLLPLPELL